jgi:putative transcriptional regulator
MATNGGRDLVIVNHLSKLLGERRMSVKDLERGAGVNYNTLYEWYAGRTKRFDASVLDRLCAFLGVSVGDILEYRPDPGNQMRQA